jgi:hypothetical protein
MHFVTAGFDPRKLQKIKQVTIVKDGYYFVERIVVK